MKEVFVKIALITSLALPGVSSAIIAPSPICTQEYAPVCGQKYSSAGITRVTYSNVCMLNADGAQFMSQGTCEQSPYYPYYPYNPQPYYPYYYGSAPSIQSFSGPTTLRTNDTGTWYVNVGSSTGTLTYSITWGDEINYAYANSLSSQAYTSQQTTFTHRYTNPGTYTVVITARDSYGRTSQATATVTVYTQTTYNPTPYYPYYPYTNTNSYNYWWNSNNNYNDINSWNYWWENSYSPSTYYNQYSYPQYNYDNYDYYGYGSSYGGSSNYNNYYSNYNNYNDSGWYPNYSYTWY